LTKIDKLLQQAHNFFSAKEYDKALFLYSQVVSIEPNNLEYQLYAIFCDIATENELSGHSLFDYFTVASYDNLQTAIKETTDMIRQYNDSGNEINKILKDITHTSLDSMDVIEYKDFETLVQKRGSFKIAFEDIMFSTKVAITSKDDFLSFVNQLIDNNFEKTAYSYLDGFNEYFKYDKKIMELYDKLGKKTVETNNK
jgi:tetratricopeptide (TPR) repeat protein